MNARSLVGLLAALALMIAGALLLRDASEAASITVRWESGSEESVAGFHLWRANPDSPMGLIHHQVSDELIPAEGSPLEGATYEFVDTGLEGGATYRYQIEEVDPHGLRRRHPDVIEATAGDGSWQRVQGGLALLFGLALSVIHLRDLRRSRRRSASEESV